MDHVIVIRAYWDLKTEQRGWASDERTNARQLVYIRVNFVLCALFFKNTATALTCQYFNAISRAVDPVWETLLSAVLAGYRHQTAAAAANTNAGA